MKWDIDEGVYIVFTMEIHLSDLHVIMLKHLYNRGYFYYTVFSMFHKLVD